MTWAALRRRFRDRLRAPTPIDEVMEPDLRVEELCSLEDHRRWTEDSVEERARRRAVELDLLRPPEEAPYPVAGRCYVCSFSVPLRLDYQDSVETVDDRPIPNWRERLLCPRCGLNNRMRATVHLFEELTGSGSNRRIYLTEQATPLYRFFATRYPAVVGSEYLGDQCPLGATGSNGWRNEDMTALSFDDESFDVVVCLDVLEHVADFESSLRECYRVLQPGGSLMVTVPFRADCYRNLVRARVREHGEIEHLLEPEYHGDPLSSAGCLAFYHYGWELLDGLRNVGFASAKTYLYWSRYWGYLGQDQTFHIARKIEP